MFIEDEPAIFEPLIRFLNSEGFEVFHFCDFVSLKENDVHTVDVIILDRILGCQDSIHWLSKLRDSGCTIPVIILSARTLVADRILGLEFGADDYLTKPFEPRELVARIKRIVKRGLPKTSSLVETEPEPFLNCGYFKLPRDDVYCFYREEKVALTQMEWRLLSYFMENDGKPLSREKILLKVWGVRYQSTRTLDLHVAQLRQKFPKECIETLHGRGYRFVSIVN